MDNPLVSVIMNCYNGEKYLSEAIESVFSQIYTNWEIIFWDNCSTDNTPNIIKKYNDHRVKYYRADYNTSLGKARNMAKSKCSGDYIAFLDADDIWEPNKLKIQIDIMLAHQEIGLIYSNYIGFWDKGEFLAINETIKSREESFAYLIKEYKIGMSSAMVRKNIVNAFKIEFDDTYSLIEDYDYFLRIAYFSKVFYCSELLVKYRMHFDSLTIKNKRNWSEEFSELHKKLNLLLPKKDYNKYSREINWIKIRAINNEIINTINENKRILALNIIIKNVHYSYKLLFPILGVIIGYKNYIKILNKIRKTNYRV